MNDATAQADWRAWLGRERVLEDVIDPGRARAMQATLDDSAEGAGGAPAPLETGAALPPLWHWLYFWTVAPWGRLGPDGHAARGGFLPPIELPRRMWAGSRVDFHRPLPLGAAARCRSVIADIRFKQGRSGQLAFVTVRHEVSAEGTLCLSDEHDIVYREEPKAKAAPRPGPRPSEPAPAVPTWRREVRPDPVLLFRYSALTFNGHRIHYDRPYATGVEGYPGLIVHGPLLATYMVELARAQRPEASITHFAFRALSPIFDTAPFTVAGDPSDDGGGAELWVAGPQGELAMRGHVDFA